MKNTSSPPDRSLIKDLSAFDWMYGLMLLSGAIFSMARFSQYMDYYEQAILMLSVIAAAWLGRHWKSTRWAFTLTIVCSLIAVWLYAGDIARGNSVFTLKYMLSSQSAILWMSTLFFLSMLFFWGGFLFRSDFGSNLGSKLCCAATILGMTGLLVRWYESYLIGVDVGHIPVSNLYEVFVLFCLMTSSLYLYYEGRYTTRTLGPFVLLVIVAAIGFLLWYTFTRQAEEIEPLVPALQSWWMKIHVPANFIGYGAFALASMVGIAYLLKEKGLFDDRLPSLEILDDVMYKSISLGFLFFTIATILGALWAADAWGGYWSWDPKETWALIVWLNYAAWLHLRLVKGLRGRLAAWWALIGLLVTAFAFLGVNMFLAGLHSYGKL